MSDELWSLVEPLLPAPPPKQVERRPWVPDRQALCGILFVLHTGSQREYLAQELGFGWGMTCWRRLAAWNEVGVWGQLHQLLLNKLRFKSPKLTQPGRPRAPGRKYHVVTDGQGIPLAVSLTGANRAGRPRRRPDMLFAVRGYDHDKYRRLLRRRSIRPAIAERGQAHSTGLGTFRRVVERTISWLHGSAACASAFLTHTGLTIHPSPHRTTEKLSRHPPSRKSACRPCHDRKQPCREQPTPLFNRGRRAQ